MIGLNEPGGGPEKSEFSAHAMMLSMERMLAKKGDAPSDQAQELYYTAMEARTESERTLLLHQALTLDPGNVDALLVVVCHFPMKPEQTIEALRKIVALGEKRLGPKAFKELAGAFWGFHETRPYMRARQQLAEALRQAAHFEEAIAEWEGMLELNPNDNQGVRYSLLSCCLLGGQLEAARKLFEKFPDESAWNALFSWARVLERVLSEDGAGAEAALAVARKQNAHVEAYLKGHRRLPKNIPEAYSPGSKEEAMCFADLLLAAWSRHPRAQRWLLSQSSGRGSKEK